ncbi:MAG: N-acetyltransferase family protein [Chitinophagaceae bacterium]
MTNIRIASTQDAAAILAIYSPYIQNTSICFETDLPTLGAFQNRIHHYLEKYPWLLIEIDGQIAGYAYGSSYRERIAYQWSAECSVYIHDHFKRKGIAQALYTALFKILKAQGIMNVYAVINLPNDQSVALHEKMGFTHFADYKNVGYKLGKWKTVGWWQLQLNEYTDNPTAPVNFGNMNKEFLQPIFNDSLQLLK